MSGSGTHKVKITVQTDDTRGPALVESLSNLAKQLVDYLEKTTTEKQSGSRE